MEIGSATLNTLPKAGFSNLRLAAEYYSGMYGGRRDIAYYSNTARARGGSYLELGCGAGRILSEVAPHVLEAVGVEYSRHMLDLCRQHLAHTRGDVSSVTALHQGDITSFTLNQTFDFVTMPFRVFQQMLTVESQLACLACIRTHLKSDGLLAFDVFCKRPDSEDNIPDTKFRDDPIQCIGGRNIMRRYRKVAHDPHAQLFDVKVQFQDVDSPLGEPIHQYRYKLRYFSHFELKHLLHRAGFEVLRIDGDFSGTPLPLKFGKDIVVEARPLATKRISAAEQNITSSY